MRTTISSSLQTSFKRDVLSLVSGAAGAQIIGLLAMPVLTRYFAPEAFGLAAAFGSITGIIVVIACLRYELSIVLPDNEHEAANLFAVSILCTIIITVFTILIGSFVGEKILDWLQLSALIPYIWLIPFIVLTSGTSNALNYWNTRTKNFRRLSIVQITSSFFIASSKLGGGFTGYTTAGTLITAQLVGQIVAVIFLGWQIIRSNGFFLWKSISRADIRAGLIRHKRFPLYSSWSALLNSLSWQLPILILGIFFSPKIVGYYALAFSMLRVPMNLIGQAISKVFLQKAACAYNDGSLAPLIRKVFFYLMILGFFPLIILSLFGKELYGFVFGSVWTEAGLYTQILCPWAFCWFISSPLSVVLSVTGKQKIELVFNIILLLVRSLSLIIGGLSADPIITISIYSITGSLTYGWLAYYILKKFN